MSLQIQATNDPNTKMSFKFHLARLNSEQAIIGRDFLSKFKSTINLGENTVTIATREGNKILTLNSIMQAPSDDSTVAKPDELHDLTDYIKDEQNLTERVRLASKHKIEAGSTEIIEITSPLLEARRSRENAYVLFEPSNLLAI